MRSPKRRYRRHLAEELDGAAVYRALADHADGERREILLGLADAEVRHARHWADKLEELGDPRPLIAGHHVGGRARLLAWVARRLGVRAVIPLLERGEATEIHRYDAEPAAPAAMVVDERVHARVIAGLFPSWRTRTSGGLRASVFGINDGLVSNLALVMGMAGGQVANEVVVLAGFAGLLGGGLSMGAGEFVSVSSQRELFAGEVELDAAHLRALPEEEANELALLLRARGTPEDEAEAAAAGLLRDPDRAARVLAREKLGFDATALGSPWGAAASSFGAFIVGAAIPVLPFLVSAGTAALTAAIVVCGLALFAVGAAISLLTARPTLRAGLRQLAVGGVAAAATYTLGTLAGVALG